MKIEKTKTVSLTADDGEKQINVSSLPENIRNDIDKLDYIREKYANMADELEIIGLAIIAKKMTIKESLNKLFDKENNSIDGVDDKEKVENKG
jgi:hypothetical protein